MNRSAHIWAEIRAGGLARGGAERATGLMRGRAGAGSGMNTCGYTDINPETMLGWTPCRVGYHVGSGPAGRHAGVGWRAQWQEATGHRINPRDTYARSEAVASYVSLSPYAETPNPKTTPRADRRAARTG